MGSFAAGAGTKNLAYSSPGGVTALGNIALTGGTQTTSVPVIDATQTWNAGGVTFTGIKFNVTDTASAAGSLLMDLQVGGATQFKVDKSGRGTFGNGTLAAPSIVFAANAFAGFYSVSSGVIGVATGGSNYLRFTDAGGYILNLRSDAFIAWASTTGFGAADCIIGRDAANTLAQRNGVNAQTFNIYNTFTDASNYERGVIGWSGNEFTISTQGAGTGSGRPIKFIKGGVTVTINDGGTALATNRAIEAGSGGSQEYGFLVGGVRYEANGANIASINGSNGAVGVALQLGEMTAPAAPAANKVRIYAQDNGSGKTQLMALFATGAAQQIAIEP